MTMTNNGTLAAMIAARALSTDCSAQVMSVNGIAMLMQAMTSRCPYTRRSRGSGMCRRPRTTHSSAAPMSRRRAISVNVPNDSTPSLMNRYDEPHMMPRAPKRSQSERVARVLISG